MRSLFLLFLFLSPLLAQETMLREVFDAKTDTHVEVTALFSQPSYGGFFPVRVKVANNQTRDHFVELNFTSSNSYDNHIQTSSSFDIRVPAGKIITKEIMVPLCSDPSAHSGGSNYKLSLELIGSLGRSSDTIRINTSADGPSVLLSAALYTPNASALDDELTKKTTGRYGKTEFSAKFTPKDTPSDWLAYSGYDSILMTDTDWSNVPAGAKNAILSWVNLGGQLIIYTTDTATPATLGIPEDAGFGSLSILPVKSALKLNPAETIEQVSKKNPVKSKQIAEKEDFLSWPLQSHFGSRPFHYSLFIIILVLFGILVGPINLFVFAKSGRRHRLFITTPLISLGTSLILIALIIFQDGFGGTGIRRQLMEVRPDGGRNLALIHQEQISRTGILLNSHFTVDPICHLTPVPVNETSWARYTNDYKTRGVFHIQPIDGKMEINGDWWQSRSEHGHAITAVIPTRGRIEHTVNTGEFISTFDFPIQKLYFLDTSKQWYLAESISTGKPFTPQKISSNQAENALRKEGKKFTARNQQMMMRAQNRANHFVAITSSAPAINTHPGIRWKETDSVITGPVL